MVMLSTVYSVTVDGLEQEIRGVVEEVIPFYV